MKKTEMKKAEKSLLVKGTEKALSGAANFFLIPLCSGALYEVKVPQKLQK